MLHIVPLTSISVLAHQYDGTIWSGCAVHLESEQTPSSWTVSQFHLLICTVHNNQCRTCWFVLMPYFYLRWSKIEPCHASYSGFGLYHVILHGMSWLHIMIVKDFEQSVTEIIILCVVESMWTKQQVLTITNAKQYLPTCL